MLKEMSKPFPLAVQGRGVNPRIGRISTGLAARTGAPDKPGLTNVLDADWLEYRNQ